VKPYVGKRRAAVPVEEAEPAPQPTISVALVAPTVASASAIAVPVQPQVVEQAAVVETTPWSDLRVDTGSLPPFDETAAYATDFSSDTTAHIPVVATGKRRAGGAPRTGNPLIKRMPSAPVVLGVASLAIAVGGAVTAAHAPKSTTTSHRFVAASALAGASDVGQVGTRSGSVSRNSDRSAMADEAAKLRTATLAKLDTQATAVDKDLAANQWGLPVQAGVYHLTGRFNDVSGLWASVHTGLDFAAPTGTPIHAVASGSITEVGWAGAYGNRTVETLPDGTELWYAHQVRFGVSVGEKVTEGQVIGYVGSTGNTTGPHIHLEVRPGGGDPVDPDSALKEHHIDPDANQ
jgi:murein DD-endopeptidase MepM/ murein hydrolase activator NlpD